MCVCSVNGHTVNTVVDCILVRLICVPGDSRRFTQHSQHSEFKPHTFCTRRVQSHMRSSACFSTAGSSTLTVRYRQNAYEELLMTPAEKFPVSIMETECPDLKLEHDENRTSEQRGKRPY